MQGAAKRGIIGRGDFMTLSVKRFSELTNDELYAVLKLRVDVFVVEQK